MGSFSTKEDEIKEERPMQSYESLFSEYPDVLTVHQVRSALGIGRAGVYKLLETRQIKCFKIGNAYKVPKLSLIEFVSQNCNFNGEGGEER